jgi:acyl dehydratase
VPFPADRIGFHLHPIDREITTRMVLAYAAGIGATEAAYLDDAQPGGLRALPFQCVSLEWPVVLSLREAIKDVLSPHEAMRGVHAVQDSTFHRPMRPGDRLVTDGRLVSARPVRAGALIVLRLVTRDRDSGDPVTTTWTTSIYRDVALAGTAASIAEPDTPIADDLTSPGPEAEVVPIPIPRQMPHVYSECAEIWNPIHTERAAALVAGLPDIILHGTATWALAGLTLLRRYGGNDVGALKRITGRFSGMVAPGETIEVRHVRSASGAIRFEVGTPSGQLAISQGAAWF